MVIIGVLLKSHLFATQTLSKEKQMTFDSCFDLPLP